MKFLSRSALRHRPKRSAAAVYIGPEAVEIVYMRQGAVIKHVSRKMPKKDVTSGTIKEIFQSEGIKETSVTTTIPEEAVMLRRFTMPIIPVHDRPAAVRFEAKRHIPFNIAEVISTFQIIKEDPAKKEMEILFAAVKKEEINSITSLLKDAGLSVERIEPTSLALIKTLILTGYLPEASPPTAILHFSTKTNAQIIIVENGIPYLKREFSLSAKDTKLDEQLVNELRLSSSYYKREFPEKNISKLIICGLSEKPEWLDSVKSSLTMPVESQPQVKNIAGLDMPNLRLEIPIGLAAMRLERQKISLNLLLEELMPLKLNLQKWAAVEVSIAVCILGLIYLSHIPALIKLRKDIDSAESGKSVLPGLELASRSTDELNILKTTLQDKQRVLASCAKNRIRWHDKLVRLTEIMPKESWITELTIGDSIEARGAKMFVFKGSTYTKDPSKGIEITNNFSKKLKEDPVFMAGFKKLTLGTINKALIEKHETVNFDISVVRE